MKCTKCETESCLTEHHCHPVIWYGRKSNQLKVCLCRLCHDKLEANILAVESYVGNVKYGTRFKLERKSYEKILQNFLGDKKIIYVTT